MVAATDEILLTTILQAENQELQRKLHEYQRQYAKTFDQLTRTAKEHFESTAYKREVRYQLVEQFTANRDVTKFGHRDKEFIPLHASELPSSIPLTVVVDFEATPEWEGCEIQFALVESQSGVFVYEASRLT